MQQINWIISSFCSSYEEGKHMMVNGKFLDKLNYISNYMQDFILSWDDDMGFISLIEGSEYLHLQTWELEQNIAGRILIKWQKMPDKHETGKKLTTSARMTSGEVLL